MQERNYPYLFLSPDAGRTPSESLLPAQQIVAGEIMEEFMLNNSINSIQDITALALFLRARGLSAETIKPVTDIGIRLLKELQKKSSKSIVNEALLALCADKPNPLESTESYDSLSSGVVEYDVIRSFEEFALDIFPQRIVELWRKREDYTFYDHPNELDNVILKGADISTLEVSDGDFLGRGLFANYDSYLRGHIPDSYHSILLSINRAKMLQEKSE